MKIIFGVLAHETNTFASDIGTFERWASNIWDVGQQVFDNNVDTPSYASGMIKAAAEEGVELIPTINLINAGPLITKEALDYAVGTLCGMIAEHKGEFDAVCLGLHGAGVSELSHDLEGYTLQKVREIVGDEMPITVTLDLHGNISEDMVRLSNGLFGIKEYPHVDMDKAGYLAMKTLIKIVRGESKPHMALVHIPMFTNCCNACTANMPMKKFTDHVREYVKEKGLIDATYFHGFPYSDVEDCGASIVVIGEEGQDVQTCAEELAHWVWDNRHDLDVECLSPAQAFDRAVEELAKPGEGYIVINEASDNPGGGCPCDGTWMLHELLRRQSVKSIVGFIHDSEFVELAVKAGVGRKVSGLLGGKTDNIHGAPVEVKDAIVCAITEGKANYTSPMQEGLPIDYGIAVRIRIGVVEVVVTELLPFQTLDDRPFMVTGADINEYGIVVVKSTNHFRAFFQPRAKAIVTTNPPGIHTADYSLLTYHNIKRPIYPMDPDTTF